MTFEKLVEMETLKNEKLPVAARPCFTGHLAIVEQIIYYTENFINEVNYILLKHYPTIEEMMDLSRVYSDITDRICGELLLHCAVMDEDKADDYYDDLLHNWFVYKDAADIIRIRFDSNLEMKIEYPNAKEMDHVMSRLAEALDCMIINMIINLIGVDYWNDVLVKELGKVCRVFPVADRRRFEERVRV